MKELAQLIDTPKKLSATLTPLGWICAATSFDGNSSIFRFNENSDLERSITVGSVISAIHWADDTTDPALVGLVVGKGECELNQETLEFGIKERSHTIQPHPLLPFVQAFAPFTSHTRRFSSKGSAEHPSESVRCLLFAAATPNFGLWGMQFGMASRDSASDGQLTSFDKLGGLSISGYLDGRICYTYKIDKRPELHKTLLCKHPITSVWAIDEHSFVFAEPGRICLVQAAHGLVGRIWSTDSLVTNLSCGDGQHLFAELGNGAILRLNLRAPFEDVVVVEEATSGFAIWQTLYDSNPGVFWFPRAAFLGSSPRHLYTLDDEIQAFEELYHQLEQLAEQSNAKLREATEAIQLNKRQSYVEERGWEQLNILISSVLQGFPFHNADYEPLRASVQHRSVVTLGPLVAKYVETVILDAAVHAGFVVTRHSALNAAADFLGNSAATLPFGPNFSDARNRARFWQSAPHVCRVLRNELVHNGAICDVWDLISVLTSLQMMFRT